MAAAEDRDPTNCTFAYFGCNRISGEEATPNNPSRANLGQLLVLNEQAGGDVLRDQLTAWVAL